MVERQTAAGALLAVTVVAVLWVLLLRETVLELSVSRAVGMTMSL